jgi:hypothetical protein
MLPVMESSKVAEEIRLRRNRLLQESKLSGDAQAELIWAQMETAAQFAEFNHIMNQAMPAIFQAIDKINDTLGRIEGYYLDVHEDKLKVEEM